MSIFIGPGKSIGTILHLAACYPQFGNCSLLTGHVSGQTPRWHPVQLVLKDQPYCHAWALHALPALCQSVGHPLSFLSMSIMCCLSQTLPFKFTLHVHLIRSYLSKILGTERKDTHTHQFTAQHYSDCKGWGRTSTCGKSYLTISLKVQQKSSSS